MTAMENLATSDSPPDNEKGPDQPSPDTETLSDSEPAADKKPLGDKEPSRARVNRLFTLSGLVTFILTLILAFSRLLALSCLFLYRTVLAALRALFAALRHLFSPHHLRLALRLAAPACVALALLTALFSFLTVTTQTKVSPVVFSLCLWLNTAMIVALAGLICHQVYKIVMAGRVARAEAWRRAAIIGLFSALAVLPVVITVIIAGRIAERGFDHLFSTPVHEIIADSLKASRSSTQDHNQALRSDILRMAADIVRSRSRIDSDRIALLSDRNRKAFGEQLMAGIKTYSLSDAMIVDQNHNVLVQAGVPRFRLPDDRDRSVLVQSGIPRFRLPPMLEGALNNVTDTEPQITQLPDKGTISAVLRLKASQNSFLYVVRQIDSGVLAQLRQNELKAREYDEVESRRPALEDFFSRIFAVLVLAALVINLIFANWLMRQSSGASTTRA